jgi:hypothetical protein
MGDYPAPEQGPKKKLPGGGDAGIEIISVSVAASSPPDPVPPLDRQEDSLRQSADETEIQFTVGVYNADS